MTNQTNFTAMPEDKYQEANWYFFLEAEEKFFNQHTGTELAQALNAAFSFGLERNDLGAYVELYFADEDSRHFLANGGFTPITGNIRTLGFYAGACADQAYSQLIDLTNVMDRHDCLWFSNSGRVRALQLYDSFPEQSTVAWNIRISVVGPRNIAEEIAKRLETAVCSFLLPIPYETFRRCR